MILLLKINSIKEHHDDPFHRIDYMSAYALNSPFLYHYNGISLYSSIFDGGILKYYDKLMQINMPVDKIVRIAFRKSCKLNCFMECSRSTTSS